MDDVSTEAPASSLRAECGLRRPDAGWWRWLQDPQLLAAALAAVPVWWLLAISVGSHMRTATTGAAWLSLVLVQPVAEEIVLRGVLQGQLLRLGRGRRVGPLTLANLATTAVFVGLHLFTQPPLWALAVAVPSMVLGHLRERFGSVLPAITMHAYYNAGFGLAAALVHG